MNDFQQARKLNELIKEAEGSQILFEEDGIKYCTHSDQVRLKARDLAEGVDITQDMKIDPNTGRILRSAVTYASISPDHLFENRVYQDKETGKLYLVRDFRAINEQAKGNVYLKQIPCYVIKRNSKKKLELVGTEVVSDTDFVSKFTTRLSNKDMLKIFPLLKDLPETPEERIEI